MRKVGFSLLSCDVMHLQQAMDKCNNSDIDFIHFDIMDGAFVPNISFGICMVESVMKHTKIPMDVHLMVDDIFNKKWLIDSIAQSDVYRVFIHYEACSESELKHMLDYIRSKKLHAGIAFNPHTQIEKNILKHADAALIMCVNPGFGGQSFIDASENIAACSESGVSVVVDGGINDKSIMKIPAHVDVVSGSYLNNALDFSNAILKLRSF